MEMVELELMELEFMLRVKYVFHLIVIFNWCKLRFTI